MRQDPFNAEAASGKGRATRLQNVQQKKDFFLLNKTVLLFEWFLIYVWVSVWPANCLFNVQRPIMATLAPSKRKDRRNIYISRFRALPSV
jgi:hypothetical protein